MLKECKYLIFDTETTGLSTTDVVIQLGYMILDEQFRVIKKKAHYLKTNVNINPKAQEVHGITKNMLEEKGSSPTVVLLSFSKLLENIKKNNGTIVAHNIKFDIRMLKQTYKQCAKMNSSKEKIHLLECLSKGEHHLDTSRKLCTYLNSKKCLSHIVTNGKGYNLGNLYELITSKKVPQNAHDALVDCLMCLEILKKLSS
jgi:DNA polymerase III epsilon subunit-like protein